MLMNDFSSAAESIHHSVKPAKLNYGVYGDKVPHLHVHIVPKYEDGTNWGLPFEMNPGKTYLPDSEYLELISLIKNNVEMLLNK
jgi:diadenosine tetraphosphate (Ap4A) HIT family hydrolase